MKMRKPITSPAAVAAGMAEVRQQYGTEQIEPSAPLYRETMRTFDHTGLLAIDPDAIGAMFAMFEVSEPEPFERIGDVAVVKIGGPLSQSDEGWWDSYESVRKRIDAALEDEATKTVCLRINSPGGDVAGCFELCDSLKKRKRGKGMIAYADGQATSAAYAIACCADKVFAPATGRIGSVGVIARLMSMAGMAEQMGVRSAIITSGARKSDGHPMVPITEDAVKSLQATVDSMAVVFFDHVAACRKTKPEAVKALEAAVLMGAQAKEAGLCDEVVGSFDDVLAMYGGNTEAASTGSVSGASAASTAGKAGATTQNPADAQPVLRGTTAGKKRKMRDALVLALGLKAEAEEVDVLGAVTALQNDRREVMILTSKPSMAEALGTMAAWKASHEALPAAQSRAAELEARDVERERDALITANERKIAPAMLPWAKSQSLEALRAFVAVAPDLVASPASLPTAPEVKHKLTPEQRKAAANAGVTEEAYAAEMARIGGGAQ